MPVIEDTGGEYVAPTPLTAPVPERFRRNPNPRRTAAIGVTVPVMRYANRTGTNCSLTFSYLGAKRQYRTRVRKIAHGFDVVAVESQARQDRAFYPRRAAISQFALTLDLIHEEEMKDFMGYLRFYQNAVLNGDNGTRGIPIITVNCPSRNFLRYGVPIGGGMVDHHVGSMVYSPTIVFEATRDPLDPDFKPGQESTFAESNDPQQKYFFPGSRQLGGSRGAAESLYDEVAPGVLDTPAGVSTPVDDRGQQAF